MLITIRRNMRTGRFHPFYWMEAPLPGKGDAGVVRLKSKSHHTAGFATLAEAQEEARGSLLPRLIEFGWPVAVVDVEDAVADVWEEGEVPAGVLLRPLSDEFRWDIVPDPSKPADYAERRAWQDAARARGDVPECGRGACGRKASPPYLNRSTPLIYCRMCAAVINSHTHGLCYPEPEEGT